MAGDYHLQPKSPAINVGDNAADLDGGGAGTATISDIPADLDGNLRIFNKIVDLGAYENQFLHCPVGGIFYVDAAATGTNTGDSWANAYPALQDALRVSESCEIWVAGGVYYPDEGEGQADNDRAATFQLKTGVGVYGGFAGTETARGQRDWTANVTVLSGDIDGNDITTPTGIVSSYADIRGDNSLHVVTSHDTDSTAVLDGFTITAGLGNIGPMNGGGMINASSGSPTLTNVNFSGNQANFDGGGMSNSGNPILTNVTFSGNNADHSGGGMSNGGNPILTNVAFDHNQANYSGGMATNGNPTLMNVTFSGNTGFMFCGGMSNGGSPTLMNVTFSNNQGGYSGGGLCSGGNLTLVNVTFSGNQAGDGGGIYSSGGSASLTNVTFSGNSSDHGGGMYINSSNSTIRNTIFWGNTATSGGAQIYNNSSTPILSNSVVQGGCPAGSTCTNIITANPHLGTLGNYGGFTQTIPLLAGSSATMPPAPPPTSAASRVRRERTATLVHTNTFHPLRRPTCRRATALIRTKYG
jgi:predicted outer membrane repeat protein